MSIIDGFLNGLIAVFSHRDGYVWVLRTILTGLLIGLGAPFWFKTYRFVAQFVPGRQPPPEDSLRDRRNSDDMPDTTPKVELVIKNSASNESDDGGAFSISSDNKTQTAPIKTPQKSAPAKAGLTGRDLHSILMSKDVNH